MSESTAPSDVTALAQERSRARAARDWVTADGLKARIEAAGWHIVDHGADYELTRAHPEDMIEEGGTIHGAVESMAWRDTVPGTAATIVVIAGETSPDGTLESLAAHRREDTEVLVVAERSLAVGAPCDELVRTVEPFTAPDALSAALRRAGGEVVVVLEPGRRVEGDVVGPILDALADPSVAIAGNEGLTSVDLLRFGPAAEGEATTLRAGCYGFRRREAIERGPLDRGLRLPGSVAAWLGLLLRDEGPDRTPRRALALDLPLSAPEEETLPDDHARLARRDSYRIGRRFRERSWLAREEPPERRLVGDGPHDHERDDDRNEPGHTGEA